MENKWDTQNLTDICQSVMYGYTASASADAVGPHLLRITDIVPERIDWHSVPYCAIPADQITKYRLEEGDIVVARTGATSGYAKYIRGNRDAVFASYLVRFRVDRKVASPIYVGKIIESQDYKDYISINVTGSAQPQANAKILGSYPLPIPPLPIQHRISHILGILDERIELARSMTLALENAASAVFVSWFIDFDPSSAKAAGQSLAMSADIGRLFPSEFEDTQLGRVPEGWKPTTLNDGINIFNRKRIPLNKRQRSERQGLYPYYGAASIMDYVDDYLFDGIYVLTGEDGSVQDDNGHPVLQYVWGQFWVNNHAHILRGKNGISTEHLYLLLKQTNIRPFVTGAVQPKLNQKNLKAVPMVLPPEPACKAFSDIIQPLFAKIRANADQCRTLIKLRDTLLPRLVSGELDVSNLTLEGVDDAE